MSAGVAKEVEAGTADLVTPPPLSKKYGRHKPVKARFWPWLSGTSLGRVPREQNMIQGHLPRVTYHQVYLYMKINSLKVFRFRSRRTLPAGIVAVTLPEQSNRGEHL